MTSCKLPRYLGIDFGDKNIGVAVSNLAAKVATGVTTIKRKDEAAYKPILKQLKEIIREYEITHIVLGNPKLLNGSEAERSLKTIAFKEKLQRYFKSISVELWDERLSTKAVSRSFNGLNKAEDYKKSVDKMAAVYILQGYLDYRRSKNMSEPINQEEELVVVNDNGEELPLQILASHQTEEGLYILALENNESEEVLHFKLIPSDDEEVILELVDEEHDEFDAVFAMFKDDYEALEISIEEEQ